MKTITVAFKSKLLINLLLSILFSSLGFAEVKCKNPVGIDDVPSDWVIVRGKDLISGERSYYQLVRVQLHSIMESADGKKASATTDTVIRGKQFGSDGVSQAVTCRDLNGFTKMTMSTKTAESISSENGSYTQRRDIEFLIFPNGAEMSADVYSVYESARFGEESEENEVLKSRLKAMGIEYDTRLYRVSEKEFEIRLAVTQPDQSGSGGRITLNGAIRYRLEN
ncbi:MAG: hypothetical protein AB7F43_14720 [Bacteriovoracia bacterium]